MFELDVRVEGNSALANSDEKMNTAQTGIRCHIYRSSLGECSNSGLSSTVQIVTLIDAEGPFTPDAEAPAVKLVKRVFNGEIYVHAEPVETIPGAWLMHGGTFIYSSDSRFHEAVDNGGYPIALHDRTEHT